jgi:hypothetical protein
MLIPTRDLWRFGVRAVDGEIGRIHDLHVDDRRWSVCDIAVDAGHWLTGHLVLIRPAVVVNPDCDRRAIQVALTAEQIADSPRIETHQPVAEVSEGDVSQFRQCDPHVRSLRALGHYGIEASDGEAGHVEDWLVDVQSWRTRYAVVKTAGGRTRRHVLVPVHELGAISWSARAIYADLPRNAVIHAPEYEPATLPNADYEIRLHGWYGRPTYGRHSTRRPPRSIISRVLTGTGDPSNG